jgi:F1F0 ATPase subunit 2
MIGDIHILALTILVGFGLGLFYFGGLWLTVKHIPDSRRRTSLIIGSFLARNAVCFGLIALIVRGGHWERGVLCILGFIIARILMIQHLSPRREKQSITEGD